MRILALTHRVPYAPNRGDRIRAYHLLKTLSRFADVHLIACAHEAEEWERRDDLGAIVASHEVVRVSRPRRLLVAPWTMAGGRPLTHTLLHSAAMRPALDRAVARGVDAVLAYCSGMARYALQPPLSGLPFVLDMVDVDSEKWLALGHTRSGLMGWVYRREARTLRVFERTACRRAATTTVISEREAALMREVAPGCRVEVVPNGVDLSTFRPEGVEPRRLDVVFCGVFSYEPNASGALWLAREVWPAVVARHPGARLVLVGMDPPQAVRDLARSPSVIVTGTVADVRPYLWGAAVAAAPLQIARGTQNKVLEALASGLPVVVTPPVFDGLPDVARPGCRVAQDAASFAGALSEWLSEPDGRRQAVAARANLATLEWPDQLAPLVQALQELRPRTE